jgi:hypothetical protein
MRNSPIFVKYYDLMTWFYPALTKFPKEQRFRLAARIEETLYQTYELILRASRSDQPRLQLLEADYQLDKLRLLVRLAKDIQCMHFSQYEHASKLINEIGRLLGGWIKSLPANPAASSAVRGEGR